MSRRHLGIATVFLAFGPLAAAQEPPPPTPASDPLPAAVPAPLPGPGSDPLPEPAPGLEPGLPPEMPPDSPPPGTFDPAVEPVEADERNPLPPAAERPGQAPPAGASATAPAGSEGMFLLPPESLQVGRQVVGLTVDVVSPDVINLGQEVTLKVVVKNTGATDARNVIVHDPLPDGLKFISSVPETKPVGPLLTWRLGDLPAGSERQILVKVAAVAVGGWDHAATVAVLTGGRSKTLVQQPLLKVEVKAVPGKVLKGQEIAYKITIENPGTGPARDVHVQAKLSPGLRHPKGSHLELYLKEMDPPIPAIGPGKRIELEALVVDAVAAGPQECSVTATSPDVNPEDGAATARAEVTVVEPQLRLTVIGPTERYTEQQAAYVVVAENVGSAPARNVQVSAMIDKGLKPVSAPDATYNSSTGVLTWSFPQLEPNSKVEARFLVRTGGIGFYQVAARAVGDGVPQESAGLKTHVQGIPEIVFDVIGQHRVLDVGDTTVFRIRLKNQGTKEASRVQVRALLSKNLEFLNIEGEADGRMNPDGKDGPDILFNEIDKLGTSANSGRELRIRAKAIAPGSATCRVFLSHDELEVPLDRMAHTRVLDGPEIR